MTGLPKRTAIITGGAKRIGGAITRALAADGWHVLIHCNQSRAEAEALATELGNASVVTADLAEPSAADIIMAACAGLPPARLLVNSASRFVYDRIEDFSPADFDIHMAVNLRAPALLSRAFAAGLPDTLDDPALVVNLLDAKLASLNPDYFTYTLSKIGFEGLTELTARSYAPRLRCVGIAPAVTLVSGPQTRENFEAVHGLNPLGRGVTVDDIVTALRFIIVTPTFNAQTIVLDGGQRLLGLPRDVAHMVEK
ncbi:SDR family oxidoreductase [Sandarakinorhabdus limnophila]|uniref:SDR family oxidoreductase n=1 Tax=Sandarakinorhabdus limnophila TaxID=210512 RepID=UPI0026F23085|nr:SDR family NAD(P)-dependent oxidoreductase [Sandarakinorhabdus limnophila]MCM0032799.1 SDR family oxidoreductase [Sandarakinorhabdus limnophila]